MNWHKWKRGPCNIIGRDVSEPSVFMVAVEDLYDKLLEAPIQAGHEAKRMIIFSKEKFLPLSLGNTITLSVPTDDQEPLDFDNIFGVIMEFKNNVYRVGIKEGLIKGWFARTDIAKLGQIQFFLMIYSGVRKI